MTSGTVTEKKRWCGFPALHFCVSFIGFGLSNAVDFPQNIILVLSSYLVRCACLALLCDCCGQWTHARCCVTKEQYQELMELENLDWWCTRCLSSQLPYHDCSVLSVMPRVNCFVVFYVDVSDGYNLSDISFDNGW